jgi:hypothetical protein
MFTCSSFDVLAWHYIIVKENIIGVLRKTVYYAKEARISLNAEEN